MGEDYDEYGGRYGADEGGRPWRRAAPDDRDVRDDREEWPPRRSLRAEPKQNGWGVASFVLALAAGVCTFLLICVAGVLSMDAGGEMNENSPEAVGVGMGLFACLLLVLLGGAFGLVGVLQPNRKRVFAILGLVFNALVVLGFLGLMLIGLAMG